MRARDVRLRRRPDVATGWVDSQPWASRSPSSAWRGDRCGWTRFARASSWTSVGETGVAELVTVAPARSSEWSTRVIAVTREFRHAPVRERVLLVLPVGRSPPRGAILEASVRVAEPRPEEDGFDERAWLGRQGIHVVLEASSWREVGRRGGLAGLGDELRDRIEHAVGRGADGHSTRNRARRRAR